ncbi:MAG: hypothetical protein AAF518_04935 [Spirochaetota bacterium]
MEEQELAKNTKKKSRYLKLVWDLIMVLIVFVNISLILFSLTYLFFRPYYFEYTPELVKLYDKEIVGIEEHRTTGYYLKYVKEYKKILNLRDEKKREAELAGLLQRIDQLLIKIVSKQNTQEFEKDRSDFSELLKENSETKDQSAKILQAMEKIDGHIEDIIEDKQVEKYYELVSDYRKFQGLKTPEGFEKAKEDILAKMDAQMLRIVSQNPFADSGQTAVFKTMQGIVKGEYDKVKTYRTDKSLRDLLKSNNPGQHISSTTVAFTWFWRVRKTSAKEKFTYFNKNLKPLFAINYYRKIGKSGKPVDNFWTIDAPFLCFFLLEFLISWFLAIKRKTYIAWFLYPMYHWYDILGLIPVASFRFFRLIRIYTMYQILQKSEFTNVGDDMISRTIKYYSNIIKEELSDMVTIQILTESQAEIRSGQSMKILTDTIDAKRGEIKTVILNKLTTIASNERLEANAENILEEINEVVVSKIGFLGIFPEKVVTQIGLAFYHAIVSVFGNVLQNETSKKAIEEIIDMAIDEVKASAEDPELNDLNTSITVELIENIKKSVSVKKWVDTSIMDPAKK